MMTTLQVGETIGWWDGFRNLLDKEGRSWWGTRLWLAQTILWLVVSNGLLALMLFGQTIVQALAQDPNSLILTQPPVDVGLSIFFKISTLGFAATACILSQGQIIGEKQRGTVQWVLSKPVDRSAFVLAKLLANAVGMGVALVGLQSIVAYGLVSLQQGGLYEMSLFLPAVGVLTLHTLFYLVLSLMLGTLSDSRGLVLGIGLGSALGTTPLLMLVPAAAWITPWGMADIATGLATGIALPDGMATSATLSVATLTVVCLVIALRRFDHVEL
jgi:ABC-type transport system involved in multi-copper enzyme maturation permease subunit